MLIQRRLALLLVLLLVSCSQAAQPTPSATLMSETTVATQPPVASVSMPTDAPTNSPTAIAEEATTLIPTAPASEPVSTQVPTPEPLVQAAAPALSEQIVLQLPPGNGAGQVAILPNPNDSSQVQGPGSFRIGSDATIRVLDRGNKRVLFFSPDGTPGRVQPTNEAADPIDYIVNNNGDVFVLDNGVLNQETGIQTQKQVVLYKADGKLNTRYPIADTVSANGIMLNTQQDLFVVLGSFYDNPMTTVLFSAGKPIDVDHQTLTMHRGMPTPRSPMMFTSRAHPGSETGVGLDVLLAQLARDPRLIMDNLALPGGAQFLNVDRAMNLYFMKFADQGNAVSIWRVGPDTTILGGGTIDISGCQSFDWRSIYIAQDGEAWRMCSTAEGTRVSRYALMGSDGQLLGPVDKIAEEASKNVPWAPGGNFTAA